MKLSRVRSEVGQAEPVGRSVGRSVRRPIRSIESKSQTNTETVGMEKYEQYERLHTILLVFR